jgi:hypothetical protein
VTLAWDKLKQCPVAAHWFVHGPLERCSYVWRTDLLQLAGPDSLEAADASIARPELRRVVLGFN